MTRPSLLAVVTVPPLPINNGFSLRVANMLRELGQYWSITLLGPQTTTRSLEGGNVPGVGRIVTVPMVGRMTYLPSQFDVRPLRRGFDELLAEVKPDALLLWGGSEHLLFGRSNLPPSVADRIDCATLTAWRQARVATTWRGRLSELSEVLSFGLYERNIDRSADHVVVVGEADAALMRRLGGRDNVHVISNGVTLPPDNSRVPEASTPTITFTGVLSYPPNVDAAIFFAREVFPLVRAQVPDAVFTIAGRSPAYEVLMLEHQPGVEVLANVAEMESVIGRSWVSVAPMQSGSGVKNKILEAWAMAKPVVMTSLAANGLDLDDQVRSLVTDAPAEQARLIVELVRDQGRRERLGAAGKDIVTKHHSWAGAGKQMDALLRTGLR